MDPLSARPKVHDGALPLGCPRLERDLRSTRVDPQALLKRALLGPWPPQPSEAAPQPRLDPHGHRRGEPLGQIGRRDARLLLYLGMGAMLAE